MEATATTEEGTMTVPLDPTLDLEPSPQCPRCGSTSPSMHPATGSGGEVMLCPDPWHDTDALTRQARQRLTVHTSGYYEFGPQPGPRLVQTWDGSTYVDHPRPRQPAYRGPARSAHGPWYWGLVGWWWEPMCWIGRMILWIPPFTIIGVWRSGRKGRKNREARERRGYR